MAYQSKNPKFNTVTLGGSKDASAILDLNSTTQGFGLPNMTEVQRDAISSPKAGLKIFNTDTSTENVFNGSVWGEISGGGSSGGSTGINYIEFGDAELGSVGWNTYKDAVDTKPVDGTGGTSGTSFVAQDTVILRGEKSFKFSKGGFNYQGEGVSYDFKIPKADRNRLAGISFDYNSDGTYTANDVVVYVYDVDTDTLITPRVKDITGYDKDNNGSVQFISDFSPADNSSENYRLIFHIADASSNAWDLYFDNIKVGPDQVVTSAVVTAWESFTPSFTNMTGTLTYAIKRRVGENMEVNLRYTGATSSGTVSMTIPDSLTVSETLTQLGSMKVDAAFGTQAGGVPAHMYRSNSTTATAFINAGTAGSSARELSSDTIAVLLSIPIAEWAGTGTVNLGANDVEYAFNTGTETAAGASNTVDFGYGPQGTTFNSFDSTTSSNSNTILRVKFTTKIQPTDSISVEADWGNGIFAPIAGHASIAAGLLMDSAYYGVNWNIVSGSDDELDIRFGNKGRTASSATTYGGNGSTWSGVSTFKWRVVKHRSGIPVGFSLASPTDVGLVKAEKQYVGGTDFTIASDAAATVAFIRSVIVPYQTYDGAWRAKFNVSVTHGSETNHSLTITGLTFKNVSNFFQSVLLGGDSGDTGRAYTRPNEEVITIEFNTASTSTRISGDVELDSKPTWAD